MDAGQVVGKAKKEDVQRRERKRRPRLEGGADLGMMPLGKRRAISSGDSSLCSAREAGAERWAMD